MTYRRLAIFCCLALLAGLVALPGTASATHDPDSPTVHLVDPSGHSIVLSDKVASNATYRLAAWTSGVPGGATAGVEFELLDSDGDSVVNTVSDHRVGDTFYKQWAIPNTVSDGVYTLRATLFVDEGAGFTNRGKDEMEVEVLQGTDLTSPAANTVDILYPTTTHDESGTNAGYYDPPGAPAPYFLMDIHASTGTTFNLLHYTTTPVGLNNPSWKPCGTVPGSGARSGRCTLTDGDDPDAVTALAAVANDTPSPPASSPNSSFNDSGDALQVFPYEQVPTTLTLTPEAQDIPAESDNTFDCATLTVEIKDQRGRRIGGANFDVHATGPNDQTKFNTSGGSNAAVRAPNSGGHDLEPGTNCSDSTSADQGEHQQFLADDTKHVEGETTNSGTRSFQIDATEPGMTNLTAWADITEDDVFDAAEPNDSARVRWGQQLSIEPASSSAPRLTCQRFEVTLKEGNPSVPVQNANIDVHISGPTSGVRFCDPADGSARRAPDQGGHTGTTDPNAGQDADGSKHTEGETNGNGKFVFGVTSPATGRTNITVFRDDKADDDTTDPNTDNDVNDSDQTVTAEANWGPSPHRTIRINAGRYRVPRGQRVRIFGRIIGDPQCEQFQTVNIMGRRPGGKFFRHKTVTTGVEGRYSTRIRIWKTKDYRAVAPRSEGCNRARSRIIRIRAT